MLKLRDTRELVGAQMQEFSVESVIAAPLERVWSVLIDFSSYAEWHPYLTIEGNARRFRWVNVSSRSVRKSAAPSQERAMIVRLDPSEAFEYVTGNPFVFMTRRWFRLNPHTSGTLLRHGIKFTGFSAKRTLAVGHNVERFRPYFEAESRAISDRAIHASAE